MVSPLAGRVMPLQTPGPANRALRLRSSLDRMMGQRLAEYNVVAARSTRTSRPERAGAAPGPAPTVRRWVVCTSGAARWPTGLSLTFRYQTARLWRQPVETLLDGPLGHSRSHHSPTSHLQPCPTCCRGRPTGRSGRRLRRKEPAFKIVTFTLLGLRSPPSVAEQLMPGIRNMRDSSTYQMILDKDRAEGKGPVPHRRPHRRPHEGRTGGARPDAGALRNCAPRPPGEPILARARGDR